MTRKKPVTAAPELPAPSRAIRDLRVAQGLSLRGLSARAGLPYSTLSKLENGKMTLTYDKLIRLAQALNVDLRDLISEPVAYTPPAATGRRSVMRAGDARTAVSERHQHHYPASELLGKMMTPIIIDVQARSIEDLGGLVRHSGEEYLYVLQGSMELHSDLYSPLPLSAGDSIYFDSGMAHGYVRTSHSPCIVLTVCAGASIKQLAEAAAMR